MGRLFHHLTVPEGKLGPVTKRSLRAWLDQILGTELEVVNAVTQEVTADGYRATVAAGGFDNTGIFPAYPHWGKYPWQVSKGSTGWIVERGLIWGRTPQIGGLPIAGDSASAPIPSPIPELPYKLADDVIAIECVLNLTFPAVTGTPPTLSSHAWAAWPAIKWLADISPTAVSLPPGGTSNTQTRAIPLAAVRGGKAYRLRWHEGTSFDSHPNSFFEFQSH
jgi:hypothetical protein